jgi:sugar phosphate isomerase/epimerase
MDGMTSRRSFIKAATFAAVATGARAAQLKTIGVQLYTVRNIMPQKPAETLQAIREIGYQEVEATWDGFEKIFPLVREAGLKAACMHVDNRLMTKGPDEMSRVVEMLKGWDFKYAVHPYVTPADRGGPDVMKVMADQLNLFGQKCAAVGIQAAYHNHAFESAKFGDQTLFQVLIDNTDKKLVGFELDVFWLSVSGNDPVEFIDRLKGRVPLIHLKDKAAGTEQRFNESVPKTAFKEVGNGTLDWANILKAASAAGVQHYFVEQDQTPGDPLDSLRQSYQYLSKLQF